MQWERINGQFWTATDGWRTNQKKLQRAWKRRALLIQLAGDSGYLAARGPVLTCQQALMAIFWVLPTVTHPKRGQQDRKRKLLQHSRNLSNLSLHPLCPPSLSWGAKHLSAHLSPSAEALGPKDQALVQGWQVSPHGHLSPPLLRGGSDSVETSCSAHLPAPEKPVAIPVSSAHLVLTEVPFHQHPALPEAASHGWEEWHKSSHLAPFQPQPQKQKLPHPNGRIKAPTLKPQKIPVWIPKGKAWCSLSWEREHRWSPEADEHF